MDVSSRSQVFLLFIFLISGLAIGLLFDFFRSTRRVVKTNDFFTGVEDVLFWIISGTIVIFCITCFTDGEIRSYMLVGLLTGVLFYFFALSKYLSKIITFILDLCARAIGFIFLPVKKICNLVKKD